MSKAHRLCLLAAALVLTCGCKPQPRGKKKPAPTPKTTVVATPRVDIAPVTESPNPLSRYAKRSVVDEFNPDVTDRTRGKGKPRRGGTLVIRTSSDITTLNPLLATSELELTILPYLYDQLFIRDAETLEYLPKMAEYMMVRDYVELRDGTRVDGLITSPTARPVEIVLGANVWTFLKNDIVSSNAAQGLLETRFGHKLKGRMTSYNYTVVLHETPDTAPRTFAEDELSTWTTDPGPGGEVRPSIKPHCVFEFHLRPGIKWHDGEPVTMRDLKVWYDTLMNGDVHAADLRGYYKDVESLFVPEDDPMTAVFVYRRPYFQATDFFSGNLFLPAHVLRPERFRGDDKGYADFFNEHPMGQPGEGRLVGCGPYKLERWEAGREIVLVRNDDYWASEKILPYWKKGQPYLDRIVWRVIPEKATGLREMENGNIDCDFDIDPATWILPRSNSDAFTSRYVRGRFTIPLYTYIGWNQEREMFRDKRVRRALTMLIPREKIKTMIHHDLVRLCNGPFFPDGPCCDPSVPPIPYDPDRARELLREAGWIDRDGDGILDRNGQKFEFEYLIHTAQAYHARIADIIKQEVGRAGIQVHIRKVDRTVFDQAIPEHNFDAMRSGWGVNIDTDPSQLWHSSQREGGSNFVSYSNPVVDDLIMRGREEFDAEKRWALFREVYRIIADDAPYTFMFWFDDVVFYSRRFRGVKFSRVRPGYDLTEWYIAED